MNQDGSLSCSPFWDVDKAQFNPACVPLIGLLSPVAAGLIAVYIPLSPLLASRPQWLQRFASETQSKDRIEDTATTRPALTYHAAFLIALASIGLTISLVFTLATAQSFRTILLPIPWGIALLISVYERPRSTSTPLLILYFVHLVTQCIVVLSKNPGPSIPYSLQTFEICLTFIALALLATMPMRDPFLGSAGIGSSKLAPTSDLRSPEDNINLWQWLTVSWMSVLIQVGNHRQVHDQDVWFLPYEFQHTRLHALFRNLKGSVLIRLLKANGLDLSIIVLIGVLESVLEFAGPILLQQLLRAIGDNRRQAALTYAVLMGIARIAKAQAIVLNLWYSRRAYERSRGEMITMIYEKTLTRKAFNQPTENVASNNEEDLAEDAISKPKTRIQRIKFSIGKLFKLNAFRRLLRTQQVAQKSNGPASTGKILNLMKNDVYEVSQRFWEAETLVTKPLALVLSIVLIWKLLGWTCLIGVVCVLMAQAINVIFVKVLVRLEKVRRVISDTRLSLSSQYIESIRHLRWYDWQESWLRRILESRQNELQFRVITGLWLNLIGFNNLLASTLFPVVAFGAYTLIAGRSLTVDIAFPALQLFLTLDRALRDIPKLITVLLNASVALGRINNFMDEPNREELDLGPRSTALSIQFEKASFSWPGSHEIVLKDITIEFRVGLTVISGRVGQGKTALLQAILGELDQKSGTVCRPNEMFGYCAQSPWLQSMSIRENILFSSPYDESRYKSALEACALIPDLASFKHGDLSNIGENGIGLSGGQKARVALARAVYSRAKILLLDDPLAALDHDTATSIVQNLLRGHLVNGRMVILATHRVDLVNHLADQILSVHDGMVASGDTASVTSQDPAETKSATPETILPPPKDASAEASAVPDKFIEDEHRQTGGVVASVYWRYMKAGDLRWWGALLVFAVVQRLFRTSEYYFLKEWGEAYGRSVSATNIVSDIFERLPPPDEDVKVWLLVYLGIAFVKTIGVLMVDIVLLIIVYVAGKKLFKDVLRRVSGATFRFYDTTPVGRLMNRLTSDFGTLDGGIGRQLQDMIWCSVAWTIAITVIAATTPLFLVFSTILTATFVYTFLKFLPTSQSLRRLEMVSLTPLMTNFGILLEGLATVRAFRAQTQFQNRIIAVTDAFQKMDHFYWSLQAWLMFRFDILAATSSVLMTLLALYENLSPGLTAFVLTSATQFVTNTELICKLYGALQMDFVSVERVVELLDLDQEEAGNVVPPAAWPSYKDDVSFSGVTLRYAEHLPPALQNVTFHIPGGSTTAIIGRTGSGKSTLALALLATLRPDKGSGGSISIGAMDLADVDVHALRQRITFVAQDPVLFPGTLRQNLDPTDSYSDYECETVLERILGTARSEAIESQSLTQEANDATSSLQELTLSTIIASGGKNLSQGQRQLLGLGRAILRRSPVVILDEATASIDGRTAAEVQRVLREELQQSTVIMIAHRVEVVRAANWVIALDKGKVAHVGPADEVIGQRFVGHGTEL